MAPDPSRRFDGAAVEGYFNGSGANASAPSDDEEMQQFVADSRFIQRPTFRPEIIILFVSWYTSFKLSLRGLVIMMADRAISVTHTTIPAVGSALSAGESEPPGWSGNRCEAEDARDCPH